MFGVEGGYDAGELKEKGEARAEESDMSMSFRSANRWPRQETLALLQIRSDMDSLFRDSSNKSALWETVSWKLANLGYIRTPEKCKEKFENVYKYHKRTRDVRSGKPNGKTYRFFDQLQAFENVSVASFSSPTEIPSPTPLSFRPPASAASFQWAQKSTPSVSLQSTVPSSVNPTNGLFGSSSSSSTASDEENKGSRKKTKKWKAFFGRLANDVLRKQDELEKSFFRTLDSNEAERNARDASRSQLEISRLSMEHENLIQERAASVQNDAAFIACLQKLQNIQPPQTYFPRKEVAEVDDGRANDADTGCSSRWPKAEVHALISLRVNLDLKYQQTGAKGLLWEEIAAGMKQIGYNRSAKRCKEKWENINKYFKKVKESNKERPNDSKTCPYFHQLDALYREKKKKVPSEKPPPSQPEEDDNGDGSEGNEDEREGGYEVATSKISSTNETGKFCIG